jgi:hypothetical protein
MSARSRPAQPPFVSTSCPHRLRLLCLRLVNTHAGWPHGKRECLLGLIEMSAEGWTVLFTGLQLLATLGLGIPTLCYLKRYVADTTRLTKEAETQSEAQVSPALVLDIALGSGDQGMIKIRNIGEHAAFDVQVEPMESQSKESYTYRFDRIAVIEKGKDCEVEAVTRLLHPDSIMTHVVAFKAFGENSSATISCKSISGKAHVFKFTRGNRARDEKLYYYLSERTVTPAQTLGQTPII